MLIDLFELTNKQVVPGIACYQLPWLKKIMTEYPDNYLKVYQYLFYTTCPDSRNSYLNIPEEDREEVINADLHIDFPLDDPTIILALEKCATLYETPILRSFIGAKKMLDKVGKYLADTMITDGKDSNAMAIDRYMTKLPEYWKMYNELAEQLKEEQSKVRGSVKISYDQLSTYKDTKEQ